MKQKKKSYVMKKSEAIAKSDPMACFYAKEDEKQLHKIECTTEDATQNSLEGERL